MSKFYKAVGVIIVTYNSEIKEFSKVVNSIKVLGANICVFDNSTDINLKFELKSLCEHSGLSYLTLNDNVGLGVAYQESMKLLLPRGISHLCILDDDTNVSLNQLQTMFELAEECDIKVLSPITFSEKKVYSSISCGEVYPKKEKLFFKTDYLLMSGTFFHVKVFDKIRFHNYLFINYIDFVFGWEFKKVFKEDLLVTPEVCFQHSLGLGDSNVIKLNKSSALQHYYQIRNQLLMMRKPSVPFTWKLIQPIRSIVKLILSVVLFDSKIRRLKFFARGIKDGVRNVSGKYNERL